MSTQLIVSRDHVQDGLLPVRHLSYSAIRSFLSSENMFFKRYVRLEFDQKEKPAMLIGKAAHETIEHIYQDIMEERGMSSDYPALAQGILSRMLNEARKAAAQRLHEKLSKTSGYQSTVFQDPQTHREMLLDPKTLEPSDLPTAKTVEKIIEEEGIQWGKTIDEEKAREQLTFAVNNYLANLDGSETISTEIMETVEFSDFEGNIMPLPLKGIIDRIERHPEHGEGLRDYKIVAMFSNPEEANPGYELQAAAFYFIYMGLKGFPPKYAMFEEVLKKESGYIIPEDPTRRLLQADLRSECDKHGITWEKYDKNADLQNKLIVAGVLVKESSVQKIVYKYEERPDIIESFLEIYKRILNRLGIIALYNVEYGELVNPFDQMNGKENWADFTEGIGTGIDTRKRPEIVGETDLLEDYEF